MAKASLDSTKQHPVNSPLNTCSYVNLFLRFVRVDHFEGGRQKDPLSTYTNRNAANA
jgi:hypothetical protein